MNRQDANGTTQVKRMSRPRWRALALGLALVPAAGCWPDSPRMVETIRPDPPMPAALASISFGGESSSENAVQQAAFLGAPQEADTPLSSITLARALEIAGIANPSIGLAEEAVRATLAELLQARSEALPNLDVGGSFNAHRGNLQSSRGIIEDVNRQSAYSGFGAAAVGAGTVGIPGVRLSVQLAAAWFDPKIALDQVTGRRFDSLAVRNTILLEVATRYFDLAGAQARLEAVHLSEANLAALVRITASFASTGQGRPADAERARVAAGLLHIVEQQAREEEAVAAAELARVLDMDPSVALRAAETPTTLLQLVDPHVPLPELIEVAVQNRPEIGARSADVAAARERLRKEEVRPLVPLVSMGLSAGEFGGGGTGALSAFGQTAPRVDFDVLAVWSLDNLGLGNLATQRARRAEVMEADAERGRVLNLIRREVTEAFATSAARLQEIELARRRVATASLAYDRDMKRVRGLVEKARPIEILDSANLLAAARQALVRAQVAYSIAQLQLFVALGQPPTAPLAAEKP